MFRSLFFPLSALSLALALSACQAPTPNLVPRAQSPVQLQQNNAPIDAQFYDTARDAYRWAEIEARRWDFSARLVKLEGSMVDERGRSFEWKFYFTALGKDKALLVTSRRDKREVPNHFFGGGMMDISWRVDSDQALERAKEQGLKTFPVSQMSLDSLLSWDIRSFDGWYRVDARF